MCAAVGIFREVCVCFLYDIITVQIIVFPISTAITVCFAVNNDRSFYVSEQ